MFSFSFCSKYFKISLEKITHNNTLLNNMWLKEKISLTQVLLRNVTLGLASHLSVIDFWFNSKVV